MAGESDRRAWPRAGLRIHRAVFVAALIGCSGGGQDRFASSIVVLRDAVPAGWDAGGVLDVADGSTDAEPAELPDAAERDSEDGAAPADTRDSGPANGGDETTSDASSTDAAPLADLRHPEPELRRLNGQQLAAIDAEMVHALSVSGLAGRTFGGLVVDLDSEQDVWADDPDRLLIPASNTKVFTTAAAIELLGPDHRMLTRVFAAGAIGVDGVLVGNLDLHGEHDFTWSHWFYADPRHPAERMADALWRLGLRRVAGDVGVWGAFLYEGHHFASYEPSTHRGRAGNAFIAALESRGVAIDGGLMDHATMALPPGRELTRWESIPLHVGAWAILRKSHNEMADILARHLGYLEGGASDYATGGAVIARWLEDVGVDVGGFTLSDGSGLALDNRVSARQIVAVYGVMARSPDWEAWRAALSVAGAGGPASTDAADVAIVTSNTAPYNGTLAGRMSGADTAGRVFCKSGTNAGITTSGVLYNRWDGRRYAFAFLMNTLPSGAADLARATQDALVAVIAKDLAGRGARPAAPTLGCARAIGAERLAIDVTPAGPLDASDARAGLTLETSRDGVTWRRDDALFVRASPFVIAAPAGTLYVRARAESSAGVSDPSDVYPVRAQVGARVLLVDADDRWQRQPVNENPMGAAHAFMVAYGAAMPDGIAIDTCPNEALGAGVVTLAAYDAVVWAAGEEASSDESFSGLEQQALADYLAIGGALFASGAEIAWDLDARGNGAASASDTAFLRASLASNYEGDDAGVFVVEGTPGGIFSDRTHNARIGFWTPGQIFVAYPDTLSPVGGAEACLTYLGPGATACVQSPSGPAVVYLGFPFESIDAAPERALVMARVLTYLGL